MARPEVIITAVSEERWREAQRFELEFAAENADEHDDWNEWWAARFDGYDLLRGRSFTNVLEVGAGPNTNLRLILPHVDVTNVFLEDPLMQRYVSLTEETPAPRSWRDRFRGARPSPAPTYASRLLRGDIRCDVSSAPLEDLPYRDDLMDCVVCINVLDHVRDADACMREIGRVLRPGGLVVLGQDLSNDEDFSSCPESWQDVGHPIKLDEDALAPHLAAYRPLLHRVLPREEGRNPVAHYGTLLFIGELT